MKKSFSLTLVFLLLFSTISYASTRYAIAPQYDYCTDFSHGIALVYKDGLCGVIDTNGSFVLPMDATPKCLRANGLIMVLSENKLAAFFNASGVQVTDYIYDVYPYTHPKTDETSYPYFTNRFDGDGSTDLIPISRDNKFGFINANGEEIIAPQFEYAYGFADQVARICAEGVMGDYGMYTNGKYGFVRADGSILLPANTYWIAGDFKHGYAAVSDTTEYYKMIDKNGTVQDLGGYSFIETNGKYILVEDAQKNQAVLSMDKEVVVPPDSRTKTLLYENIIIDYSTIQNRAGEILYTAPKNTIINLAYTSGAKQTRFAALSYAPDSPFATKLQGIADINGKVLLEPIYDTVFDMGEGLLYAQKGTESNIYDYNGNRICALSANNPGYCHAYLFPLLNYETSKYGYIKHPLRDIPVFYNGTEITFDVPPLLENGRTLVPLRAIFEALDATVDWDNETRTVTASRGDIEIRLTIDESILYKNGEAIQLDTYARIDNSRTLVPLRALTEAFGCIVVWDGETRTVNITE